MSQFDQFHRFSFARITYATGLVRAIFVGMPQEVPDENGKLVSTSIFKSKVDGPVMVRELNLDGDAQADLMAHGGPDKAIYCYPAEHYEAWQGELGRELSFGMFGENLTVSGLLEDTLRIGDILTVGDAVLQVSQPRFPCYKLGIKMQDPQIIQRFQQSGRSGFYCRVLEEGMIDTGLSMDVVERDMSQPTVVEVVSARNRAEGI
jgi:MOSC domain-containing protein YiiM